MMWARPETATTPEHFMTTHLSTAARLAQAAATADATTWGAQLERTARAAATVLVLLYCVAADLMALTYRAGFELGRAVHQLNDRLADPAALAAEARATMQAWLEQQRAALLAFLLLEVEIGRAHV